MHGTKFSVSACSRVVISTAVFTELTCKSNSLVMSPTLEDYVNLCDSEFALIFSFPANAISSAPLFLDYKLLSTIEHVFLRAVDSQECL